MRCLTSLVLLGLLLWGGWAFIWMPEVGSIRSPRERPAPPGSRQAFHGLDRAILTDEGGVGECEVCHGDSPHARVATLRAFLNLHTPVLGCGVCHLGGPGIGVRRFRGDAVVTDETLASGTGGRLRAARKVEGRWVPVIRNGEDVRLRSAGPLCEDCHRRGSLFLAVDGLYDDYRRRLLEDLAVLKYLRRNP